MHARFIRLVLLPAFVLNLLAYGIITTIFEPQAAHAQAYVIGSDPVDGSTVNTAPSRVRIFFNDDISTLSTATIQYVQNGDFIPVQAQSVVLPTDTHELDIPMPSGSSQGSYFVRWAAISTIDGRTTYGGIGFDIGHSSLGLPGQVVLGPSSSNDLAVRNLDLLGTLAVAWEWLVLVALIFWIGILVTERLVLTRTERATPLLDRVRRHTLPMQWLCLSAMLIGEVITMLLREVHVTRALYDGTLDFSALFPFLTQTVYGWLWFARIVLLLLTLGLLWWLSRPYQKQQENLNSNVTRADSLRPRTERVTSGSPKTEVQDRPSRPPVSVTPSQGILYTRGVTIALIVLTALILCTYALTDTQVSQLRFNMAIYDGFSLLAQGLWFGSLAYLGYLLLPVLPTIESDSGAETLVAFLRNLTPYLITGIVIALATLLFLIEATVFSWTQWLGDPYGRALLVRSLFVILTLLLTLYTLLVVRPKIARQAMLLHVVNAELPARRARQTALERRTRGLKQIVSLQALLAAAILLCAALMTFYAPPIVFPNTTYSNPSTNPTNPAPAVQTQSAGGLNATLQVSPGRVNTTHTVTLHITDTNGSPVTNAHVQLITKMQAMDMGVAQQVASENGATYTATFTASDAFSMSGTWDIHVVIQRAGKPNVTMTFSVAVG